MKSGVLDLFVGKLTSFVCVGQSEAIVGLLKKVMTDHSIFETLYSYDHYISNDAIYSIFEVKTK